MHRRSQQGHVSMVSVQIGEIDNSFKWPSCSGYVGCSDVPDTNMECS